MSNQEDKKQQSELILHGDMSRLIWKLSLPAMAAMVLFGLNAFLDSIFVGQLIGEKALAGVALAYPLAMMMMGFGSLLGTGSGNIRFLFTIRSLACLVVVCQRAIDEVSELRGPSAVRIQQSDRW